MSSGRRLQFIYLFCHFATLFAFFVGDSFWWLWAISVYLFLQIFGVGLGLHRLLSHKSFPVDSWAYYFLTFVATLTGMGSPISWAGIHRLHHGHADQEKDPHSFRTMGLWSIFTGAYAAQTRVPPSLVKDLVSSRWLLFLHRHYFSIHLIYGLILIGIDWKLFLFQYAVPITLVYGVTATGICLNHWEGYRNFPTKDLSTNSFILSFLTLGDGWHNNHHADPSNYSHQVRWWEFDLCAYLIRYVFKSRQSTKL